MTAATLADLAPDALPWSGPVAVRHRQYQRQDAFQRIGYVARFRGAVRRPVASILGPRLARFGDGACVLLLHLLFLSLHGAPAARCPPAPRHRPAAPWWGDAIERAGLYGRRTR